MSLFFSVCNAGRMSAHCSVALSALSVCSLADGNNYNPVMP